MDGRLGAGIAEMRRGMEELIGTERTEFALPSFYAQVAHFHGQAGAVRDGLVAIEQGISMAEKNGDYFSWPELQRVKGELLLVESAKNRMEAAACFHRAIEAARRQEARMLELRAAVGLAEIWDRQGKREEALELLSPLYARFSEGFDTADLRAAKALLDHVS